MEIRHLALILIAFALVAAGCGRTEQPPSTTFTSTSLHIEDRVVVVDDDGEPLVDSGWTVVFEAGTPWGPDGHGAGGYWESRVLAGEEGLLVTATGEGEENAVIDLFRSHDGTAWEQLEPVLGGLGIEFFDLAIAGPNGFVLGGLTFGEREDDVETWLLESADGAAWTDADPDQGLGPVLAGFFRGGPDAGVYGTISSMVRFGDTYVAGGNHEEDAVVWISEDGITWERHTIATGFGSWISGLAAVDDRIYAAGSSPAMTVWESADGITWSEIAGPEAFGIESAGEPADGEFEGELLEEAFHSGSFVALAPYRDGLAALIQVERRRGPAWCYVDPIACFGGSLEIVASTDGMEWLALPMPDDASLVWDGSLASIGNTLILAEANDGKLQIWTAGDLGSGVPIEVPVLPDLGFEIIGWGETLEQGIIYGYPFWTHCGIERLGEFNGQAWTLVEGSAHELPPDEWGNYSDMLYGTMQLVATDRIEYTLSGVVIGSYEPNEDPEEFLCA